MTQRCRRGSALVWATGWAVAALVAAGCAGPGQSGTGEGDVTSAAADAPDPGFGHVHGLGLNPGDGAVYAATHFGLWRLPFPGAGDALASPLRVADRWQDTMGFSVAGPDLFFGSGHPDLREDAPPLLGFIVSRDRAETWEPVSLRGQADFHDIAVSGDRLYGYDATSGRLLVSDDGGRTWITRTPLALRDVTIDPTDPDRILATSPEGLLESTDAGSTFRLVAGAPPLVVLDWVGSVLAGADGDGAVWAARDGRLDRGWQRHGSLSGAPQAFTVVPGGRLLAADEDGVQLSTDGGREWTLLAGYDGGRGGGEHE